MNEEQISRADEPARKIMTLSRNSLLVKLRFPGNALLHLPYRLYDGTMGTDGEYIYYQPVHILRQYKSAEKLVAHDYLHMIMHCIFRHNFMGAGIEQKLRDLSCDIAAECQIASLGLKATPHKERLTALHVICLHIFRHLARKLLDIRQYACVVFIQSAEKSDCASDAQSLCGVALIFLTICRWLKNAQP